MMPMMVTFTILFGGPLLMVMGWRQMIAERRMGRTKDRTDNSDSQSPIGDQLETERLDVWIQSRLNAPSTHKTRWISERRPA